MFFAISTIATTTSGGRIDYVIYVWSFIKLAFCVLQIKTASMHLPASTASKWADSYIALFCSN